jgi:hypothetical protein
VCGVGTGIKVVGERSILQKVNLILYIKCSWEMRDAKGSFFFPENHAKGT